MKSTKLADLFYKYNLNPFYVISPLILIVPLLTFLFCAQIMRLDIFHSSLTIIIVFICCTVMFYKYFHRNPERELIEDEKAILSPADGKVVYIHQIKDEKIITSKKKNIQIKLTELLDVRKNEVSCKSGVIIDIDMQLFDVHITRCPISGKKILDHHTSGRIVTMNNPQFELINDRETVVVQQEQEEDILFSSIKIAVVQIATFITRTVRSFVHEKKQVKQGEPLGMIRLGSQVDLIIFSSDVTILVKEHERVYAGVTKIAEIKI